MDVTRQWLAHHYARAIPAASKLLGKVEHRFVTLDRALCEGFIDLIFAPPPSEDSRIITTSTSSSSSSSSDISALLTSNHVLRSHHHHQQPQQPPSKLAPGYPETLWLDQTRMSVLSTDAADLTAVYMLLMLYRQMAHVSPTSPSSPPSRSNYPSSSSSANGNSVSPKPKIDIKEWELARVKREIWEVGPARLGWCFFHGGIGALPLSVHTHVAASVSVDIDARKSGEAKDQALTEVEDEARVWRRGIRDVLLQVSMRSRETASGVNANLDNTAAPLDVPTNGRLTANNSTLPDPATLTLLEGWMDSNMKDGSTLHTLLRKKLRDALLDVVCRAVLPATNSAPNFDASLHPNGNPLCPWVAPPPVPAVPVGSGLEPLMPEIRHLGDRIAKLVAFHSHVYRHLYVSKGFVPGVLGEEDD